MFEGLLELFGLEGRIAGIVAGANQVLGSQGHGGGAAECNAGLLHIAGTVECSPQVVQKARVDSAGSILLNGPDPFLIRSHGFLVLLLYVERIALTALLLAVTGAEEQDGDHENKQLFHDEA